VALPRLGRQLVSQATGPTWLVFIHSRNLTLDGASAATAKLESLQCLYRDRSEILEPSATILRICEHRERRPKKTTIWLQHNTEKDNIIVKTSRGIERNLGRLHVRLGYVSHARGQLRRLCNNIAPLLTLLRNLQHFWPLTRLGNLIDRHRSGRDRLYPIRWARDYRFRIMAA
jgi:hypothetical protein